jgi:putative protein kinase ArgK-like GTPase of G3E family
MNEDSPHGSAQAATAKESRMGTRLKKRKPASTVARLLPRECWSNQKELEMVGIQSADGVGRSNASAAEHFSLFSRRSKVAIVKFCCPSSKR